jgi:hypothetical protein
MTNQFTIASAYQWSLDGETQNNSEKAIKHIYNILKSRFSENENQRFNYNINYRRLRASAGKTMLKSIVKRIETSQVIIIDLSTKNSNVFIEVGLALAIEKYNESLSIYFIREKDNNNPLPNGIPSDLQGYFISEYISEGDGKIVFKDNNSLRMSIESDIKEYFNTQNQIFNPIDEIN